MHCATRDTPEHAAAAPHRRRAGGFAHRGCAEEFLSDAGILERCRNFAAQIQSETALEKACSLIEGLAARPA
jgi:hypothetical protein